MAILTCDYFSRALSAHQCFTAVLPSDAMPGGFGAVEYGAGPYPTLYLLHGFGGNRNDWLMNSRVQEWASMHGWAVVMPDGANSFYLDQAETNARWGEAIGQELVEVTRKLFPLSTRREDTAIGGLSMGGFGALRLGLRYPETFGHIAAMSSALITEEVSQMTPGHGNMVAPYGYYRLVFGQPEALLGSDRDPKALAKALAGKPGAPRLFLACGTEDMLYPLNLDMHTYLESLGYDHVWFTRPGIHDFSFWNEALQAVLPWLHTGD